MVSTRRKKKSEDPKPNNNKKRCIIDMNHIPESLKREGYSELNTTEEIPNYLKCPTCKELLVDPEMYVCGHTLCKICIESTVTTICPICKRNNLTQRLIPNFILREMIETNYPHIKEKRMQQLNEMRGLKEKLLSYQRSTRFKSLNQNFNDTLQKNIYCHYRVIIEALQDTKNNAEFEKQPVTEEEVKFFLACILKRERNYIGVIGEHLVDRNIGVEAYINWVFGTTNKKKSAEHKKWAPLILMNLSPGRHFNFDMYCRLSKIYKVDIGNELPLEEWKGKPAYWLKDIELELVDFLPIEFSSSSERESDEEEDYSSYYSDF